MVSAAQSDSGSSRIGSKWVQVCVGCNAALVSMQGVRVGLAWARGG